MGILSFNRLRNVTVGLMVAPAAVTHSGFADGGGKPPPYDVTQIYSPLPTLYHHFPVGARSARLRVDGLRAEEVDDQLIRQAHNVRAGSAEAPFHAVVVGAGGVRDGDFAILHGDDIFAAVFESYGKLLVFTQVYRFHHFSAAGDLGKGGVWPLAKDKKAAQQAEQKHPAQK